MISIAILLAGAAIGYAVAQWLRLPPTPLLVIVGVIIARVGAVPSENLEETLILGVTFLLFITGIELNPHRIRTQKRAALRVGLLQFALLGGVGFLTAQALGYDRLSSVYISLALTASSTLVVIRLLQKRRQLFEPTARLVIGVLLLQDMLIILLIPAVTELSGGLMRAAMGTAGTLLLFGLAWVCARWVSPLLLRVGHETEVLLLGALSMLFVFIGATDMFGLPLVTGAFLAGVALSPFPVNGVLRPQLNSIADFFNAIFFTALGAIVPIPGFGDLGRAIVLALVVILFTPPLVAYVAERYGFSLRQSIESGLLLAQTSEISLVVGLYGLLAEQIAPATFGAIALVTVVTMVLTPFLAADRVVWWLTRRYPAGRSQAEATPENDHVLLLGTGATGMPLLESILGAGHRVVVVDDDPVVIARLREADISCIRGDATDPAILRQAHADRAAIITSTIRRPEDNRRVLEFARGVPVIVRVFDEHDARWIEELGGTPIVYADAAAEGMLRWFDSFKKRG